MELFTKSKDPDWERIVDITVEFKKGIPEQIGDETTFKFLFLDEGSLTVGYGQETLLLFAPAMIALTHRDQVLITEKEPVRTTTVFFRPSVIREEFAKERILSGEFADKYGQTIHQDYMLLEAFAKINNPLERTMNFGPATHKKVSTIVQKMDAELRLQADGFWPCRSRSCFMELLYHFGYENYSGGKVTDTDDQQLFDDSSIVDIVQYLNDHIDEHISLEDVLKEFAMNRNQLNKLFLDETSMTCMNYLMAMRMNLAKIMLAETELPIGEISVRVGYPDQNYFARVFKRTVGVSPLKYRQNPDAIVNEN